MSARAPAETAADRLVRAERDLQRVFNRGGTTEERSAVCAEWRAAVHAWWADRKGKQ